jgi:hypothetical protein
LGRRLGNGHVARRGYGALPRGLHRHRRKRRRVLPGRLPGRPERQPYYNNNGSPDYNDYGRPDYDYHGSPDYNDNGRADNDYDGGPYHDDNGPPDHDDNGRADYDEPRAGPIFVLCWQRDWALGGLVWRFHLPLDG